MTASPPPPSGADVEDQLREIGKRLKRDNPNMLIKRFLRLLRLCWWLEGKLVELAAKHEDREALEIIKMMREKK